MQLPRVTGVVLTGSRKVALEVGGRPFITRLLAQLARAGAGRLVLCVGHQAAQVAEAVGDEFCGLPVLYSEERSPLGTAGALRQAWRAFGGEAWLAVNGDSYVATDLWPFAREHAGGPFAASLLLASVDDCARFGSVEHDGSGRLASFQEKRGDHVPGWISGGIYLLHPLLLDSLPDRVPLSIERDVFPDWVPRGLGAWPVRAPFLEIGAPEWPAAAESFFAGVSPPPRGYVVLDRDGTLIAEKDYLSSPDQVELLPRVREGLRAFRQLGYGVIVVTNQSGIGRGYFTRETVAAVHARMRELLEEEASVIEAVYICPHTPEDECACRKPKTALLETASRELGFALADSVVIGDKVCDIDLGRNAGARTILVTTGYGKSELAGGAAQPDWVADDLFHAAELMAKLGPTGLNH